MRIPHGLCGPQSKPCWPSCLSPAVVRSRTSLASFPTSHLSMQRNGAWTIIAGRAPCARFAGHIAAGLRHLAANGSVVGKFAAGETGSARRWKHFRPIFIRRIDLKHFLSCRPTRPANLYTAGRPCGMARSGIRQEMALDIQPEPRVARIERNWRPSRTGWSAS